MTEFTSQIAARQQEPRHKTPSQQSPKHRPRLIYFNRLPTMMLFMHHHHNTHAFVYCSLSAAVNACCVAMKLPCDSCQHAHQQVLLTCFITMRVTLIEQCLAWHVPQPVVALPEQCTAAQCAFEALGSQHCG
jgi:hypothetical protein